MKLWMRKALVTLIAVVTLGMYTPTALLEVEAEESKNNLATKADIDQAEQQTRVETYETYETYEPVLEETEPDYIKLLQEQARIQSLAKFGPRITERVGDEFMEVILPKMESVLESLAEEAGEDVARYYEITEKPARGYGERIFHVTDQRTGKDVIWFHVRRDNRPLEGYYFNFHYHVWKDGFQEHHELGEIFWDKNTPPKWMT